LKEVEKIVSPSFKEMKNGKGKTPYALFAEEHEKLRKQGEMRMMNTAEYSMVVAALIGSVMFGVQLADGLDHSLEKSTLALAFSYSSAIALLFSSTSLIIFLSILTSRYSYEDFLLLPVRLMIGVTSLFISITAMMVAFIASFCLKNHNHLKFPLIFVVIGLFASVPISYVLLKYPLCVDIVQSACYSSSLFQPRQHLLY
jgi:hypothetical protein